MFKSPLKLVLRWRHSSVHIVICWVTALSILGGGYRRFGGTRRLQLRIGLACFLPVDVVLLNCFAHLFFFSHSFYMSILPQ
jgi:hypothetical protein